MSVIKLMRSSREQLQNRIVPLMPFGRPAFFADSIGKATAAVATLSFKIESGVGIVVDEQGGFAVIERPNDSEVGRTVPVGNRTISPLTVAVNVTD